MRRIILATALILVADGAAAEERQKTELLKRAESGQLGKDGAELLDLSKQALRAEIRLLDGLADAPEDVPKRASKSRFAAPHTLSTGDFIAISLNQSFAQYAAEDGVEPPVAAYLPREDTLVVSAFGSGGKHGAEAALEFVVNSYVKRALAFLRAESGIELGVEDLLILHLEGTKVTGAIYRGRFAEPPSTNGSVAN